VGTLRDASGKYGKKLVVPISIPDPIAGLKVRITRFQVKVKASIKKKGKTYNDVTSSTKCPKAGWPFKADWTFADGQTNTASTTVKCS
jgi:hypothetical protein